MSLRGERSREHDDDEENEQKREGVERSLGATIVCTFFVMLLLGWDDGDSHHRLIMKLVY